MKEMQDKFLMLAEKLGLKSNILDEIKKCFSEMPEENSEDKWMTDKNEPTEWEQPWVKIDISKSPEVKIPSEEDLSKMSHDELLIVTKWLIKKPANPTIENTQKDTTNPSPFVVMMKKQWY